MERALALVRATRKELGRHAVNSMAGGLAFFALFALPPLLLVALVAGGAVFGEGTMRDRLLEVVEEDFGEEGRQTVEVVLEKTPRPGRGDWVTQLVGVLAFFFGATATFQQLQSVLNQIWEVPRRRGWRRWLGMLLKRLLSFVVVVGTGVALVAYLAATTFLATFPDRLADALAIGHVPWLLGALEKVVTVVFVTVYFTIIFKLLPDTRVRWGAALRGALVSAVLAVIGKQLVEVYLHHTTLGTAYGAAGSLVVTLIWLYVTALVVLVGAVFGRAWTRLHAQEEGLLAASS